MKEYYFRNLAIRVREDGSYNYKGAGWTFGKKQKHLQYKMIRKDYVHRLMAIAFVRNPNPKLKHVDHIDQNKLNNAASNLRWVTPSLNRMNQLSKNYEYNRRYKNYRIRVLYNDKLTVLGWYRTAEEAQKIVNAWKAVKFHLEFLSFVTNDLAYWHSENHRSYLSADKSIFAERVEFINTRIGRHRTLRKAMRLLLANNPSTTVAIRI